MLVRDNGKDFFIDQNAPLYTSTVAAKLVGASAQTLRQYERFGFVRPARGQKYRLYSYNDIKWIRCIREMIHAKKLSVESIRVLLDYAPCWTLRDCPEDQRGNCTAFVREPARSLSGVSPVAQSKGSPAERGAEQVFSSPA